MIPSFLQYLLMRKITMIRLDLASSKGRFERCFIRAYRFSSTIRRLLSEISPGKLTRNCPKNRSKVCKKTVLTPPWKTRNSISTDYKITMFCSNLLDFLKDDFPENTRNTQHHKKAPLGSIDPTPGPTHMENQGAKGQPGQGQGPSTRTEREKGPRGCVWGKRKAIGNT